MRLTHTPEAVKTALAAFRSMVDASEAVSAIIAAGMIPAALEMLDEAIIKAINAGTGAGYPEGAGAVLLVELDTPGHFPLEVCPPFEQPHGKRKEHQWFLPQHPYDGLDEQIGFHQRAIEVDAQRRRVELPLRRADGRTVSRARKHRFGNPHRDRARSCGLEKPAASK